jgi:hypothetical protein
MAEGGEVGRVETPRRIDGDRHDVVDLGRDDDKAFRLTVLTQWIRFDESVADLGPATVIAA